jgi:hypothetical protein
MHWRTPFPPKRASVLQELMTVVRQSLHPDVTMVEAPPLDPADLLPDELPPAAEPVPVVRNR